MKVWLLGEIDGDRLQFALTEADQDLRAGRGRRAAMTASWSTVAAAARPAVRCVRISGTQRFGAGGDRFGQTVGGVRAVQAGQCDHHLASVAGDAAARAGCRRVPGAFAVHLGVRGVAEPQFDAGADLVLERRPDLRPARRRHDDVDAERKPLSGKRGDRPSRPSKSWRSVAQPSTTRNTSPNGSSATVGSPADRRVRYSATESIPRRRNVASRVRNTDSISATVRRHRSVSSRPATDPTWGSARNDDSVPPPKSRQ